MLTMRWRRFIKRIHPEGIPWPATIVYNALSSLRIFHEHYRMVAEEVARWVPGGRILDVGTGPGRLITELARCIPNARITGMDISPGMARQARRNLMAENSNTPPGITAADAHILPFKTGVFDLVISTGSIHHWRDSRLALMEIHRILKPGGTALIFDIVRNMPADRREAVRRRFGGFRLAMLWLHSFEEPFLNVEEMAQLGRESPFTMTETRFIGALCCLELTK